MSQPKSHKELLEAARGAKLAAHREVVKQTALGFYRRYPQGKFVLHRGRHKFDWYKPELGEYNDYKLFWVPSYEHYPDYTRHVELGVVTDKNSDIHAYIRAQHVRGQGTGPFAYGFYTSTIGSWKETNYNELSKLERACDKLEVPAEAYLAFERLHKEHSTAILAKLQLKKPSVSFNFPRSTYNMQHHMYGDPHVVELG